jgi:hypothetical protein
MNNDSIKFSDEFLAWWDRTFKKVVYKSLYRKRRQTKKKA